MSSPVPALEGAFTTDPPTLLGSRCRNCGAIRFPSNAVCANCQHADGETVELSRRGVVYTYTIVHAAPPGYQGEVPYALGVVELPEGLRVGSTLLADDLEAIDVGDPCELELFEIPGEPPIINFGFRVGGA
ncbi:MAG: Zn-ribbon domain-containing OB-fold protein [Solirubrobacterales bacterium]